MAVTTEQRERTVTEGIREISHIATLPEITMKIIELVEDPSSTAQDLHELISNDPALCARILKVVNSSFYGLPGQIGSINRGIVMLGLNAVKNIAIAASLAKLFRGGDLTPTFNARSLWQHSSLTAIAAKIIADRSGHGMADEAYLAGLIHDIGLMVEMQLDRNSLIDVVDTVDPDGTGEPVTDFRTVELATFGATHEDFGKGLCVKWKFPDAFRQVAGHHHEPENATDDARTLVQIVHVADRIAGNVSDGLRIDLCDLNIDDSVLENLGLSRNALGQITEEAQEAAASFDFGGM